MPMSLWFVDMNQRVKNPGCVVVVVRVDDGVGHVCSPDSPVGRFRQRGPALESV